MGLQKNRLDDRHVGSGLRLGLVLILFCCSLFFVGVPGGMSSETLVAQKPRLELDHGPTKMGLVSDFLYIFW